MPGFHNPCRLRVRYRAGRNIMTDILAKKGVSVWEKSPRPPKLHLLRYRRNTCLRLTNAGLFHYAGNNPVRYIDPDGREDDDFDLFEDAKKGFGLIFDFATKVSATNFPKGEAKELEDFMNDKPQFWGVLAVTGLYGGFFGGIGYDMYSKGNGFTDFVDGSIDLYNDLCDFGIDFKNMTYKGSYCGLTNTLTFIPSISISDWVLESFGAKTDYSGTMKISDDLKFKVSTGINFTVNCRDRKTSQIYNYSISLSFIFKSDKKCNVNFLKPNFGGAL